ncbi:MAG: hypothetical protein R3C99_12975 [Pirellulaceae bacterium]
MSSLGLPSTLYSTPAVIKTISAAKPNTIGKCLPWLARLRATLPTDVFAETSAPDGGEAGDTVLPIGKTGSSGGATPWPPKNEAVGPLAGLSICEGSNAPWDQNAPAMDEGDGVFTYVGDGDAEGAAGEA